MAWTRETESGPSRVKPACGTGPAALDLRSIVALSPVSYVARMRHCLSRRVGNTRLPVAAVVVLALSAVTSVRGAVQDAPAGADPAAADPARKLEPAKESLSRDPEDGGG